MLKKLARKWADRSLEKEIRKLETENQRLQEKLDEYRLFVERRLKGWRKSKKKRKRENGRRKKER